MPRKIRELKAQISLEGFVQLPKRGKGSHERWRHPMLSETMTIPGKNGSDVPRYLEKQLKKLLAELEKEKKGEGFVNRYSMTVQWSDEDRLFLVTIPEFIGRVMMPCTHGETREKAIQNGEEVIEMYLEAWREEGEPIPEPKTLQVA